MNQNSLYRKAFYIGGMVALLIPLFILGQPPSSRGTSNPESADALSAGNIQTVDSRGGTLARIREHYDIGQASLGQLDPASETMRLASLGLRGVAATILWQKSDYYKTEKFYDRLSATLNQLALLQPHFVSVWESQAHNLAYNVSAEFDDYRERYAWVKKGIDYLENGTKFNRKQPILQWFLGKYMTQKLGRSDEKRQFRELFRNDSEYHGKLASYGLDIDSADARGADRKPDNWLVGRLWFNKAYDLVKAGAYCKKNPLYFYAESSFALIYSAEAMEEEGVLDDKAMFAWSRAAKSWEDYSSMDIMTVWGHTIQLRELDVALQSANEAAEKFESLVVGLKKEILIENKSKLTEDEFNSLSKNVEDRTPEEHQLALFAAPKFMPNSYEVAQRMPREQRSDAIRLLNDLSEKQEYATHIQKYREQSNFDYWDMRGKVEQKPATVAARRQVYEADNYLSKGDLDSAVKYYKAAWHNWGKVFRSYPLMMLEENADDVLAAISRYAKAVDVSIDDSFTLADFVTYRTIRDKNKMGEAGRSIYDRFVANAHRYEGSLEIPYEVGDPEPENLSYLVLKGAELDDAESASPKATESMENVDFSTKKGAVNEGSSSEVGDDKADANAANASVGGVGESAKMQSSQPVEATPSHGNSTDNARPPTLVAPE